MYIYRLMMMMIFFLKKPQTLKDFAERIKMRGGRSVGKYRLLILNDVHKRWKGNTRMFLYKPLEQQKCPVFDKWSLLATCKAPSLLNRILFQDKESIRQYLSVFKSCPLYCMQLALVLHHLHLGPTSVGSTLRFFIMTYSHCVRGNISISSHVCKI